MSTQQEELEIKGPGVEKVSIPEIDSLAAAYVKIRDSRCALTAKEVEAKEKLVTCLHANEDKLGRAPDGTIRYEYDGSRVELFPTKEKLRVKAIDAEEDDE